MMNTAKRRGTRHGRKPERLWCGAGEPSAAPAFDRLEPRVILGLIAWDGGAGDGLWGSAGNWSTDSVPTEFDDVALHSGAVVICDTNAQMRSLVAGVGSELTLTGGATFRVAGGDWLQDGDLTLDHAWVELAPGRTLSLGETARAQTGSALVNLSGNVENRGVFTWRGGDLRLDDGAEFRNFARPNPAHAGFILQTDQQVSMYHDGSFVNPAGAVMEWRQTGHDPISAILVPFTNAGTVRVRSGTMLLDGTTTNSGVFELSHVQPHNNGEPLIFRGDSTQTNARFTGSGRVAFTGASDHTFVGDIRFESGPAMASLGGAGKFLVAAGTTAAFHGPFWHGGGQIVVDGTLVIAPDDGAGSPTAIDGLWLTAGSAGVAGRGALVVNGLLDWKGGEMRAGGTTLISPGARLSIGKHNQGGHVDLERTLTNRGLTAWAGGTIRFDAEQAKFINDSGGTFNAQSPEGMVLVGNRAGTEFVNRGFFNRNGAFNTTTVIGVNFQNTGVAKTASGTLRLSGGGASSGVFAADDLPGRIGRVWLHEGTFALQHGARLVSNGDDGRIDLGGGPFSTVTLTGVVSFEGDACTLADRMTLRVAHGAIGAVVGKLSMIGGTIDAAGVLVVGRPTDRHDTMTMEGGAVTGNGTLRLDGRFAWTGGEFEGNGLTAVRYQGQLTVTGESIRRHERDLDNLGRVRVVTAEAHFLGDVQQIAGGVLTGGAWSVANARIDLPAPVSTIAGGARLEVSGSSSELPDFTSLSSNQGQLTITAAVLQTTGNFTNAGTITLSSGARLNVNGNFTTSGPSARLWFNVQSAHAAAIGRITAGGRANLGGAVVINRIQNFAPPPNLTLELVRGSAGRSGQFQTVTFQQNVAAPRVQSIIYGPTSASLAYRPA